MRNKKLNIFVYFLIVLILYLLFEAFTSLTLSPLVSVVRYSKYGVYIISETCWLFLVLFAIFIFKDTKIFSEKKESLPKTLLICFPLTFIAIVYMLGSIKSLFSASLINIVGLIIYALTIGLTEELLVRGWILSRFFKKYDKNRKEIYLSIIFSALIFGGMHISNIWTGGQTVSQTLLQIVFATAAGIFFGAAYYRSRNIMGMAFVHAFYDFSILINEINYLRDCSTNNIASISKYQMFLTICNSLILILSAIIIMRPSKTNPLLGEEVNSLTISKDKEMKSRLIIACLILYFITNNVPVKFFGIKNEDLQAYKTCYYYPEINLKNVETSYNNYSEYIINNENIEYKFINKKEKLLLIVNNKEYELAKDIIDYKIVSNNNRYIIYYLVKEENSSNSIIYYSNYLETNSLSNEEDYINNFKKSFLKQGLPPTNTLGTIREKGYDYQFPLIKDYNNDLLLIDEENIVRRIVLKKKEQSDLIILKEKKEIEQLKNNLYNNIPFFASKNIEFPDAYHGEDITIDNIDINIILNNTYNLSTKETIEMPIFSSNCLMFNPCLGDSYVNNIELINNLKNRYNKEIEGINFFNTSNGVVELNNDYWVLFKKEEIPLIEKINIIEEAYHEGDEFIIIEKAAFIYNDSLSKYSDIDNSIVINNKTKEELNRYFNNHIDDFSSFLHTFKYDKSTNNYYYYSTEVR